MALAYGALVRLKHLLVEDILCFLRQVLEVEKEKAVLFQAKADEVVNKLNKCRTSKDAEGIEMRQRQVSDRRLLLTNIVSVLHNLDGINSSLENFLGEISNSTVMDHLQKEFANELLSASREIIEILTLCKDASEAAISVCRRVGSLMRLINGYYCTEEEKKRIRMAADKAADCIEDSMASFQQMEDEDLVKVKNMYDLLKQSDQLLPESLDSPSSYPATFPPLLLPWERQPHNSHHGYISFSDMGPVKAQTFPPPQMDCYALEQRSQKPPGRDFVSYREDVSKDNQDDGIGNIIHEVITIPPSELKFLRIWETTIAQKVYNLPIVANKFRCLAWVNGLSNTDQILSRILHSLPYHFHLHDPDSEVHGPTIEDEGELLYRALKGEKYLIVVDGLRNFEIIDTIQRYFPDDKLGSRVLLVSGLNPGNSWKPPMENDDTVVGLDEDMIEITDELTGSSSTLTLSTVAITGMGGIGKTTLARKIYDHPGVLLRFHHLAWIDTISDFDQVLSHLLQQIDVTRVDEIQGKSIQDRGEILYRSLKGSRYLIVVDDLLNFEVWDAVQRFLPDDKNGSRVLITTRMTEFPTCSNIQKNPPHFMIPLDRDQSWELLEKLVFRKKCCPDELVEVGKEIAERCGGLPLAITVIAGILHIVPHSISYWSNIKREVISIISSHSDACLDILALSYKRLPHYLKICFLYMGAFPANSEIGVEYLLNLWVANGFLVSKISSNSESEAESYLEDLVGRNLVSVGKRGLDGKIKTCRIHALVRELCLREAHKDSFMLLLEAGANAQVPEQQRHLIFNMDNLDGFQLLPPLPHLSSFIWLQSGSDFTSGMVLLQLAVFKWIRVLDIYSLPFDTFPTQLLNLLNLRYLALDVTHDLDSNISQLSKLQTLVVYGPWVANPSLFLEFWKMPCLRNVYIRVPSCLKYPYLLSPLLDVPQAPSNLQSLSMITFSCCTKELFLLMPNLKKLGVSETKEDFEDGESPASIPNFSILTKLLNLKCSFYKGYDKSRNISLDVLPVNLKKLTLNGGGLSWDKVNVLASLPKLETLKLKNYYLQGPEWLVTEEVVFGSLKQLMIDNSDLVNWEVDSTDQFPCLRRLVLRSCKYIEEIPSGIGELSVLNVIELHHCNESAKSSAKDYEEQNGFPKVVIRV